MKERINFLIIVLFFIACYFIPWSHSTIRQSGLEAFMMLQEYAREHVLTCLIPAFFIAGAIAAFVLRPLYLSILVPKRINFFPTLWPPCPELS